jgi:hypothetical protein
VQIDHERLAELLADRLAPALPGAVSIAPRGDTLVTSGFLIHLRPMGDAGDRWESLMEAIATALEQIEDDASEATGDRYESDLAVEQDQLRIWFGRVPSGTAEGAWRDVLPELAPIPLTGFTTPPATA